MKYIDAERLRKEVRRLERAANKSALGCADSETRKFHEGKAIAYQFAGILLDSLQQEQQEDKPNLVKSLEEYFEKTPKEQLDADWEKLKVWNEIGPDAETYCKALREQQEVDLEKEIEEYWIATEWSKVITLGKFKVIARYFYGLGQLNSK